MPRKQTSRLALQKKAERLKLSYTDYLALERSKLANERTFLAYFRTFIVFISFGFALINLGILEEIAFIGYWLIVISPVLLFIGIFRFYNTRKRLEDFYN